MAASMTMRFGAFVRCQNATRCINTPHFNSSLGKETFKTCQRSNAWIGWRNLHGSSGTRRGPGPAGGWRRVALWGGGGVAVVGAGVYLHSLTDRARGAVLASSTNPAKNFTPVRSVKNATDTSGLKLTLFQYQSCPFCCKVRAYLDFYGYSYDVVEVNSVWRKEIKWSKYKKVPILVVDGIGPDGYLQLNDSSVIISILESHRVDPSTPVDKLFDYYPGIEEKNARGKTVIGYPNKHFIMLGEKSIGTDDPKEERQWRQWTDDSLVHMLSPNVYRTPKEAVQAFQHFSTVGEWEKAFSTPERLFVIYVGAAAMYVIGKMLKKRYNLKSEVRESLYDSCQEWMTAIGLNRQYLGGSSPNLADLAVYGVLSSIEGCDAFEDVCVSEHKLLPWYNRVKTCVRSRRTSPTT